MQQLSKWNKYQRCILMVLDMFSDYGWIVSSIISKSLLLVSVPPSPIMVKKSGWALFIVSFWSRFNLKNAQLIEVWKRSSALSNVIGSIKQLFKFI